MANYFTDRIVQYPGRVMMTPTGASDTYDLARAEGTVTTPGSPFNAETFNGAIDLYGMWYGTCSTAAATATKVVTCPGFQLVTGATIAVYFTYGQSSTSSVYLNVNGTGAKQVLGSLLTTNSNSNVYGAWGGGEAKMFVYDGTAWRIVDRNIITTAELTAIEETLGISPSSYSSVTRTSDILAALANRSQKTYVSPSDVTKNISSDNADWQSTGLTITLPTKGVWLLLGSAQFASNGTGRRGVRWSSWTFTSNLAPTAAGGATLIQSLCIMEASRDSYSVELNVLQNSGSSLSVTARARAVKIGELDS